MKFSLEPDGTLVVFEPQHDANGVTLVDASGAPLGVMRRIGAQQIAACRRDPDFDAALPEDIRAALDKGA